MQNYELFTFIVITTEKALCTCTWLNLARTLNMDIYLHVVLYLDNFFILVTFHGVTEKKRR